MIKKRIIPCLDVKNGRVVKGINFKGLRDIGDPVELAARYNAAGADELVFLDVSATDEGHDLMLDVIKRTAEVLFIPLAIGGGIRTADDIGRLLKAGADKVSINSAALARPELIREAAERFGSQCVCLSVDAGWDEEAQDWFCFTHGGKKKTDIRVLDWVTEGEKLGAGEILLTSMEADGTKDGFDLPLLKAVEKAVTVPVIASGGAGNADDFVELFRETDVSAGLAASIFHNEETTVGEVKSLLSDAGIPVRLTAGGVPNEA
ncbi:MULTISPECIES: imidazole glycerol phosphate synthase subunit HisF [Bhargavaea]|uniref:Imidazole glycerol phosphate synthase subunit HisF n=1 Tax=Bhargavaea changchunensis TaxID=2134037 RepID=A0ABW2NDJ8_9BACL|nr:imidazole glycerol phosphate synthase subunit HisF [Bhargavaea sp. CC-171006]